MPFFRCMNDWCKDKPNGVLGFDFERGRLDESAHPFSGGVPEDTRLTTRYREDDFVQSLMGTIHETGHGRYEQNRPRAWIAQPVSEARSMAIHESQSLSFEMQLGSHPGFAKLLAPLLPGAVLSVDGGSRPPAERRALAAARHVAVSARTSAVLP